MISIIVPIYNVQKYLNKCLDSILDQCFEDFEVILINDGSTDDSLSILIPYLKDPRFKIIDQQNKGISAARNSGLKLVKGEYVLFLDSDDFLHSKTLGILYQNIQKENLDFISFGYTKFSDDIPEPEEYTYERDPSDYIELSNPISDYLNQKVKIPTNACSRLYKKDSIAGLSFKEGIFFETLLFTSQYFLNNVTGAHLNQNFYYYRENPQSITNSSFTLKKALDYLSNLKDLDSEFKNTPYSQLAKDTILSRIIKDVLKFTKRSENKDQINKSIRPIIKQYYNDDIFSLEQFSFKRKFLFYLYISKK